MPAAFRFAALAAALLAAAPAAAASLVANGDFEAVVGADGRRDRTLAALAGGGTWDVFDRLPGGWRTVAGPGIEAQADGTLPGVAAHSGVHLVELDSHSNSSMTQDLGVLAPGAYTLSFWYRARIGDDDDTNRIDFGLAGGAALTGSVASGATDRWTRIARRFEIGPGAGAVSLHFAAAGKSDSYGGLIDTVSVASMPLPPAGWMLVAGIGGLVALRRIR